MAVHLNKVSNRDIMAKFFSQKKKPSEDSVHVDEPSTSTPRLEEEDTGKVLAIVRNIPKFLRSKDLRKYFSDFTENEKFACFHYRHRPEVKSSSTDATTKTVTCCCVVVFRNLRTRSEFLQHYNGRKWMNSDGMEIPIRCYVNAMKMSKKNETGDDTVSSDDIRSLIELRPPTVMPNGNVGTPSEYFMDQVRLCKLPSTLIPKLGLQTGRRKRKYDSVPFNYNEFMSNWDEGDLCDDSQRRNTENKESMENEQNIQDEPDPLDPTDQFLKRHHGPDNDEGEDNDADECEEWERHEALHDDVTEQDRTKPRKYEEELEVVWEKGGPGLVWYTDKQYWDEREKGTDCDWAWADDWDVDYSVYYDGKSAGTIDGRQAVEIREDEDRRTGKLVESAFTKKREGRKGGATRKRRASDTETAYDIEQYSKRVGSKILGKLGWKEGSGLGKLKQGRVAPVALQMNEDGQTGFEKKGFGYRGERLQRSGFVSTPQMHAITSKFDHPEERNISGSRVITTTDNLSTETLLRSSAPTRMKYR